MNNTKLKLFIENEFGKLQRRHSKNKCNGCLTNGYASWQMLTPATLTLDALYSLLDFFFGGLHMKICVFGV